MDSVFDALTVPNHNNVSPSNQRSEASTCCP
jgi:hypothetical protein